MGIDRPDDPERPRAGRSDHPAYRPHAEAETRYRQEADADLRVAAGLQDRTEPAGRSEPGARAKPPERTENAPQAKASASWEQTAEVSRWMWSEYKRRWPPEERPPVDRSKDAEGSWRGDRIRYLSPADNAKVDQECDSIAARERDTITPKLREVESRDPERYLVGFKHRLKNRDRIKEKVYDDMDLLGRSPSEAIWALPDAIRYTFQYDEARYTRGVHADIEYMKEQGFKLVKVKNLWSYDQYKGVNSQWIDSNTGQRVELQFHTRISFEAKQITHKAYERLRTHRADAFEELVLEAFQRKVTADVPVPPGASDIPDYPERGKDAR